MVLGLFSYWEFQEMSPSGPRVKRLLHKQCAVVCVYKVQIKANWCGCTFGSPSLGKER